MDSPDAGPRVPALHFATPPGFRQIGVSPMTRQSVFAVCFKFEHRQFEFARLIPGTISERSPARLRDLSGCTLYAVGTCAITIKTLAIATIRVSALVGKIRKMKLSEIFPADTWFLERASPCPFNDFESWFS